MVIAEETHSAEGSDAEDLLVRCGSLLFGEFVLASGRKTDYYFDSKQLTLDPEGAQFVAEHLFRKIVKENIQIVGGAPISAIPIASYVCLYSGLMKRPIPAFYTRKESKGHGLNQLLEGKHPEEYSEVAIVDDVVTSGDSLLEAIDTAKEQSGCEVRWALALVDRNEGGRERIEAMGYKFWSIFTMDRSSVGQVKFRLNDP